MIFERIKSEDDQFRDDSDDDDVPQFGQSLLYIKSKDASIPI